MVSLGVALIAYGRYKYLGEAVHSIASQSRELDEVIVFTDNREVVKSILRKHRVKAEVYEEPDLSLPATYARVGEVVNSEYVLPLEDDDVFKSNKLEIIEKYCNGKPLIKHATDFIDEESKIIDTPFPQPANTLVITKNNAWRYQYHTWPSTFAIKTTLLRKYRDILFKLKLHADFAIFTLALLEGEILYIPEKLTYYRIGSGHSQLTSCEKLPKLVCTWNKYAYDDFLLWKTIRDKRLRKIALKEYLQHLLLVYLLNDIYGCQYKYESSYFHVFSVAIKYVMNYFPHLDPTIIKRLGGFFLSSFLGKKHIANIFKTRLCKNL